ncbi:MAG: NADPH-dependent glutamate synthase [Candidatus Binataceae bacterium]
MLDLQRRTTTCEQVVLGLSEEHAVIEALRCVNCKDPKCVEACPLHIDIKSFIARMVEGDFTGAFVKVKECTPLPGVTGRVCQHELYCEKVCLIGDKFKPVAIGSLERFAADYERQSGARTEVEAAPLNGLAVALIGSGPASLTAAHDLTRKGYRVTIFEALHELGGVLVYGIPPFRLPRDIISEEIARLKAMGVEFETDYLVGRTVTIQELFDRGYSAVFVATGAGSPTLMSIPGENLLGVYTANEFLTRINLMRAYEFPKSDTPVKVGKRTVVVGGGNSAMDAARWAKRLGSDSVIMFRRGRAELRARVEEIEHAMEEGVGFEFLTVPVRLFGDDKGRLCEMECVRMRLGEPDASGRPSPIVITGSQYRVPVDTIVMAVGQSPNPTVQRATPQLFTKRGKIVVDEAGQTSMPKVFAGGDVARGGATVILAMRDGRAAAEAIDRTLKAEHPLAATLAPNGAASRAIPRNRILTKRMLAANVAWLEIAAPDLSRHWKAGQFVIIRPTAQSERIPVTIVGGDPERGSIVLVIQAIGKTSSQAIALEVGDRMADLLGPLGEPLAAERVGNVLCAGGGLGVAELLPVANAFRAAGNHVLALCGARSTAQIVLDDELKAAADEVLWATDDGSGSFHGTVVDLMKSWKASHDAGPQLVYLIGPVPMMRAAAEVTRRWGVPTLASLNPIMIDGTGMCGGCRVTVGGKIRFTCVEGPAFDAHQVDFDELVRRNSAYAPEERQAMQEHTCRLGLGSP